jgi:hypothetical protein
VVRQQLLLEGAARDDLDSLRSGPGLGHGRRVQDLVVVDLGLGSILCISLGRNLRTQIYM